MATTGADTLPGHATQLAAALLQELPGRLWEGKASVLKALAALCKACPNVLSQAAAADASAGAQTVGARVVDALCSAAGRQNVAFRQAALAALETALTALQVDCFDRVAPLLLEGCRGAAPTETSSVAKVSLSVRDGRMAGSMLNRRVQL